MTNPDAMNESESNLDGESDGGHFDEWSRHGDAPIEMDAEGNRPPLSDPEGDAQKRLAWKICSVNPDSQQMKDVGPDQPSISTG